MTEEQIRDGYERLDSSLHAPMDALDRVEGRMAARRRNRRAGIALSTAAVVAAVGGYVAVSAGDPDERGDGLVAVDPPASALVMTRPDGSTYEFGNLEVTCDGSLVHAASPRLLDGERLRQPFVYIEVAAGEAEGEYTLPLPVTDEDDPTPQAPPFVLFIGDNEGGPDGNEVSSDSSSTGTLTITRASCDPTPALELEVDVTLGSEEQTDDGQAKQSLDLEGALR